MSKLDQLPPDQRAVLSLLLRQGKSYGDVAALLRIDADAVRDRALAALKELGPHGASAAGEVGDYLLGQEPNGGAERARALLRTSPQAGAWARGVSAELGPLSTRPLPEIPAPRARPTDEPTPTAGTATAGGRPAIARPSRRAGAILLAVVGVIVAAIVIIVLNVGGGGPEGNGVVSGKAAPPAGHHSATNGSSPRISSQINLFPPGHNGSAIAIVSVITQGSNKAFALQAQHLAPTDGFSYAVWLYSSPSHARLLGFIDQQVTADGRASGIGVFPSDAGSYREMAVTRETQTRPRTPGPIVVSGALPSGL